MNKILLSISLLGLYGIGFAQTFTMVNTFAGTGTAGLVNGPLASAQFNGLYSLCCDFSTGDLYVSDAMNSTIRKISNGQVTTLAGSGSIGDVDGQGTGASFYYSSGLCFKNGYVYVSDNGNNKVKKIDAAGNVTTVAGTGIAGYQDGPVATALFNNPTDVKVVTNGDIYVADYGNNCIRVISNGIVSTFAGVAGGGGDQLGPVNTALFNRPSSICIDPNGVIYVADQVNNKLKVISNGQVTLLAGSGTAGNLNGTGAGAILNYPSYVDFDLYGNILFSEWINNDLRRCTPSGTVSSIAGSGTYGLVNGNVTTAEFANPYGICVDQVGTIYVGDKMNNVVRSLYKGDVGIAEYDSDLTLFVFPNPTNDQITLRNEGYSNVQIFDLNGKLIREISVTDKPDVITVSVAELPAGEYMVVALNAEHKLTGKFIKQ